MAKKAQVEIAWHPNFREVATLPDIKVVRSSFFINFGTLAVCVVLFCYWVFIEFQISTVKGLIVDDAKQIKFLEKGNTELLKQSQEFERWASIINEVQGFVSVAFKPSTFLTAMGEVRPANMTMSQLSYSIEARSEASKDPKAKKGSTVNYVVYAISITGSVTGTSQQATKAIESFNESLVNLPLFKGIKVSKPYLKSFVRDSSMDLYSFIITLEVRP